MNNIILIGFMGCGKSSIGVRLSYGCKLTMVDTDAEIERQQGCSISELFASKGEAYFRQLETECLNKLLQDKERHIISTGGGLPLRKENQELLSQLGTVVYLRVKPETVVERLKGDKSRPLLQGDNPQEKVRKLLSERKETYERLADIIVDVDQLSFEQIVEQITRQIV